MLTGNEEGDTEGAEKAKGEEGGVQGQRVSTLFQPNFGVFGIDLSGGGCWELPMSNLCLRKKLIFSGANRVSAAFQLRFSYVSAQLSLGFFFV